MKSVDRRSHRAHLFRRGWILAGGILFFFAGVRDWIAPGFLSNGRHWGWLDIAVTISLGVFFIALFIAEALRRTTHRQQN
jgi:hypothetical protein